MLEAVFLGQHGHDDLNADFQFGEAPTQRVAMMFMSGATRNENLKLACDLAQQALPAFKVVPIYGDEMTNRSAEREAKEAIEVAEKAGQSVLFISAGMAQRSFSVGKITELYLAYDSGDVGATIQKISRALTPYQVGKVGRIVSMSFDPNRDDKFDALLLETALNYKKKHQLASTKDALRDVIRTVDIFRCSQDGAVKLETDTYLEQALARQSVSRVIGKTANLSKLTKAQVEALAKGNAEAFTQATIDAAAKGKTGQTKPKPTKQEPSDPHDHADEKMIAKVKEMITTVVEHVDVLMYGAGCTKLFDAFEVIRNDAQLQADVEDEFGIPFQLIVQLFEHDIINLDLLELQVDH